MDAAHRYVQVFTGDGLGDESRTALAVEPMTAPANTFRTGDGLIVLGAAGSGHAEHSSSWGIRAG
jgi:aldose 1-epimerase